MTKSTSIGGNWIAYGEDEFLNDIKFDREAKKEALKTHQPYAQDGSCSGLQHYSAMLRDTDRRNNKSRSHRNNVITQHAIYKWVSKVYADCEVSLGQKGHSITLSDRYDTDKIWCVDEYPDGYRLYYVKKSTNFRSKAAIILNMQCILDVINHHTKFIHE